MPHLVIERIRPDLCSCALPRRKDFPVGALAVEVLDILASVIFVVGSVMFLPKYSRDAGNFILGCECFIYGSIIICGVTVYTISESVLEKGWYTFEVFENFLYMAGSVLFIYGTYLFLIGDPTIKVLNKHRATASIEIPGVPMALTQAKSYSFCDSPYAINPAMTQTSLVAIVHVKELQATVLFIAGSLFFCMAAFCNALSQKRFNDAISAMLTAITFLYMSGSILFAMGSMAFLPDLGCGESMVALGAWGFIVGSALFVLGGLVSLARTIMLIRDPDERAERSVLMLESRASVQRKDIDLDLAY